MSKRNRGMTLDELKMLVDIPKKSWVATDKTYTVVSGKDFVTIWRERVGATPSYLILPLSVAYDIARYLLGEGEGRGA